MAIFAKGEKDAELGFRTWADKFVVKSDIHCAKSPTGGHCALSCIYSLKGQGQLPEHLSLRSCLCLSSVIVYFVVQGGFEMSPLMPGTQSEIDILSTINFFLVKS